MWIAIHSMRSPVPGRPKNSPRCRTTKAIDEYDLVAFRDNVEHLGSHVGYRLILKQVKSAVVETSTSPRTMALFVSPSNMAITSVWLSLHLAARLCSAL
jgi:hypothetical protein